MNQSELKVDKCHRRQARENTCKQVTFQLAKKVTQIVVNSRAIDTRPKLALLGKRTHTLTGVLWDEYVIVMQSTVNWVDQKEPC